MSEHTETPVAMTAVDEPRKDEGPQKLTCQICGATNSMYPGSDPPRCDGQVEEEVQAENKKTGQERVVRMVRCNHAAWSRTPGEGESKAEGQSSGRKKRSFEPAE